MELKYHNSFYNIDLQRHDDSLQSVIDGVIQPYTLRQVNDNIFQISSGVKNVIVYCAGDDSHFYINFNGKTFVIDKVIEEQKSFGDMEGNTSDVDVIKPPMPGSVVKVLVETGQKVADGDGLIIIEAMKMEMTLYSSITGVVAEINAEKGHQVDTDKVLLVIKKESGEIQ